MILSGLLFSLLQALRLKHETFTIKYKQNSNFIEEQELDNIHFKVFLPPQSRFK